MRLPVGKGPPGEATAARRASPAAQLDDHHVAADVHVVELAVHVRDRGSVVLDGLADFVGPAVRHADRHVDEHAVGG
jgi:hypothetical protein